MNCDRARELFTGGLFETLNEQSKHDLEAHLKSCASCRTEVGSLASAWEKLDLLPAHHPTPALDDRFESSLKAYRDGMEGERVAVDSKHAISQWLSSLWPRQPAAQFAMAVLLFACGMLLGSQYFGKREQALPSVSAEAVALASLREEVASMKQLLTLSLLEQSSASERLRGVEWTSRLEQPGVQVLTVLLRVLELDSNVNVRLAAVEALQQYWNTPEVRAGLVNALAQSQPPMVQIDLLDAMVRAKESNSITIIKTLLQTPGIDAAVRERAEWALQQLG